MRIDLFLSTAKTAAYVIPQYPDGAPVFKSWHFYIHFFVEVWSSINLLIIENSVITCVQILSRFEVLWDCGRARTKAKLWKKSIEMRLLINCFCIVKSTFYGMSDFFIGYKISTKRISNNFRSISTIGNEKSIRLLIMISHKKLVFLPFPSFRQEVSQILLLLSLVPHFSRTSKHG